jgi:DNA ligase D-like protein (predicted ligase)/DNA ligase D-like protein (predicted polymerase)/DNA ligase D-like protein (predicted 3'-phosphoesterase)
MARTSQYVKVGKRTVELSNLKKLLFPEDEFLKAELIQYYLTLAPTILSHIKGRPLSVVRYPDGVGGESFFQKNRPDWAPEWMDHIELGDKEKKIDYMMATEEASLVFLANLACIELHQMHSRSPNFDKPDYFVVDLDPPEHLPFHTVVLTAIDFKEHLESYGYHPFVKTTGKKGLHIVAPIEPKWSFDEVFEAAKSVAQPFVDKNRNSTTLHIKKEYRKGKILVDIYRNRTFQTIVSPYSVRGSTHAPVSTPLTWEELEHLRNPSELNLETVPERILSTGDPWEAIGAYATSLHTRRRKSRAQPVEKQKAAESLKVYDRKRSFEKTPEPAPKVPAGKGNSFVVHRHHASRLHYDLRLEKDGTLKSWAVPKGLPPRPGIKRLAVQVEDHPLDYLTFEGKIPKGEYGGGDVWVFALGKYVITKEKKDGFYFRLQSKEINAEYRTFPTDGKNWLLERLDNPQIDWLRDPVDYMLSESKDKVPTSGDYFYEVKWDGIRAMISLDEGVVRIRSRNKKDITMSFPELLIPDKAFRATCALFDCEIVCLDSSGKPVFKDVINRMRQTTEGAIQRARAKFPAVCYIFDCLYLDGRPIVNEPLARRRAWLKDVVRPDTPYRVSEVVEEGEHLFEAAKRMGLEGIMAKERNSPYVVGKRSSYWLKVKTRRTADCVIIGYTRGKGNRDSAFGALHIAEQTNGDLHYVGKVGTGFDDRMLKSIFQQVRKVKETRKPINVKTLDDAVTVWIEPKLFCEVQYASLTKDGMLREPVFLRLRPDLTNE